MNPEATPTASAPIEAESTAPAESSEVRRLSAAALDVESRLGLEPAPRTAYRSGPWLVAAALLTAGLFGVLAILPSSRVVEMFTQRGPVPYVVMLLSFWAALCLLVKLQKIGVQRRALAVRDLVPREPDFVLSPGTAGWVLDRLSARCVDPHRFLLFDRISFALSNLKNMGRVGDVDDALHARADADADAAESSYTLLRGLVWAIPVLGFIGTVQGLSVSLGAFGGVIQESADFEALKPALRDVTGGLATAFDTTLLALVAALIVQMLLTLTRKREEELLDACQAYCLTHLVGKLRLSPFEAERRA
ncbi:MAG: MotA/TolQ/ExbB proton channel family protein [Planctomycetota bacterium]